MADDADDSTGSTEATREDLDSFLRGWEMLREVASLQLGDGSNELQVRIAEHLGTDPMELESATESLTISELANHQLAIDALDPNAELIGFDPNIGRHDDVSLKALVSSMGRMRYGPATQPPTWVEYPIDVDEQMRCVVAGVWLVKLDAEPVVVGAWRSEGRSPVPTLRIEVIANDLDTSRQTLRRLAELRAEHNVYRGKVLGFSFTQYGEFGLEFIAPTKVTRDELILPEDDLVAIENHAIAISQRAAELTKSGRHLKRGLLLYGPPGTGKTHTVSYLVNAMPERTTIILQGPSAGAIGQAAAIARSLPPATIVIEDVDLVAHDRGMMGMGNNPLLFQLLNEMDGFDDDSDLLFVLTTNRAEVLEPALAARPGRIDQAIEIAKPDADARRRLLELYLEGTDHSIASLDSVIDRLEGVTASFVKELVRRAMMSALDGDGTIGESNLDGAITDLLEGSAQIAQSALGVGDPPMDGPPHGDW